MLIREVRRRLLLAAVTTFCAVGATVPSGASAALLNVNGTVSLNVGSLLDGLQTTLSGVPASLTGGLCPPTNQVPVVGTVTCNLDLLSYRWYSRYRRADGTVLTREVGALLNVPTLLHVDDDPLPDVVATLTALSLDRLTLRVDRLLGETSPLPLALEAIVKDPTKGSLPRETINFGFDARGSRAPQSFQTTISLLDEPGGTRLRLDTTTSTTGSSLGVLGGLFDGATGARRDEAGGRVAFRSPVPAATGAELAIGSRYAATLTASSPTTVDVEAGMQTGDDRRLGTAHIERLPSSLAVALTPRAGDRATATYRASAPVSQIAAGYRQLEGDEPVTVARVTATDVPRAITVERTGAQAATLTTEGGAIGSVRAGFADGEPRFLGDDHHYFHAYDDGQLSSLAARVDGVRAASFDGTAGIVAEAELASKPLRALVEQPGRRIEARLRDVPAHLRAEVDPDGGTISYDGFGHTISAIDVAARQGSPFLGRADRLDAAVRDLPPKVALSFGAQAGAASLTASAPVGAVELAAFRDGDKELPPAGEHGLVLRDVPDGRFALGARVRGLERVSVAAPTDGPLRFGAKLAAGPLSVAFQDGEQTVDGRIADLPGELDVLGDLAAGKLSYRASAPIGRITLDAHRPGKAYFARATRVHAAVTDVPQELDLELAQGTRGVTVSATPEVGAVELSATDGEVRLPAGDGHAAVLRDLPGEYTLAARARGVRHLEFRQTDAGFVAGAGLRAGPLSLEYADGERTVEGSIEDVPAEIGLTANLADGRIDYEASDEIGRLSLSARRADAEPWFGRATRVGATLRDLPRTLSVGFKPGGLSLIDLTASDTIGAIELLADDGEGEALPADGANGIRVVDTGEDFAMGARIQELSHASFAKTAVGYKVGADAAAAPFTLSYTNDEEDITGAIRDLPGDLELDLRLEEGRIVYDADAPIAAITLDAVRRDEPYIERIQRYHAALVDLPRHLDLRIGSGSTELELTASEPIGTIAIAGTDVLDGPAPVPSGTGIVYEDTPSRFVAGARLDGLQAVRLQAGGGALDLTTTLKPGPLDARYVTSRGSAVLRLRDLPGSAHVTVDPASGRVRYEADRPIGEIFAEVLSEQPLVDRVRNARLRLTGVPAGVTVQTRPHAGGFSVAADQPLGSISAALSDGELHELDAPGAFLRATAAEFRAAVRVDGLRAVEVRPDPLRVAIKAAAGQRFGIDVRADVDDPTPHDPCQIHPEQCIPCEDRPEGCEEDPCELQGLQPQCEQATLSHPVPPRRMTAAVDGEIDAIPAEVTLERTIADGRDTVSYTASDRTGRIRLDGTNLPGDTQYEKPLHARVLLEGVPRQWSLDLPRDERVAFATNHEGVDRIEAEVWHTGERWTNVPAGNVVRLEDIERTRHALVRILDLDEFEARLAGERRAYVRFTEQPEPLTVRLDKFRAHTQVRIQQPPQVVDAALGAGEATQVRYRASAPIPSVHLEHYGPLGPLVDVRIDDVPREMDICFHKGQVCNDVTNDWYDRHQQMSLHFDTNDDATRLRINGRVCFELGFAERSLVNCNSHDQHNEDKKFVRFHNVRLRELRFEMGRPEDDKNSVYIDTGEDGVLADELVYRDPDFPIQEGAGLRKSGEPLIMRKWGIVVDEDLLGVPDISNETGSLVCDTPGDFFVGLLTDINSLGLSEYFGLTGLVEEIFCE